MDSFNKGYWTGVIASPLYLALLVQYTPIPDIVKFIFIGLVTVLLDLPSALSQLPVNIFLLGQQLAIQLWEVVLGGLPAVKPIDSGDVFAALGAVATAAIVLVSMRQLCHIKGLDHDKVIFEVINQSYKDAHSSLMDGSGQASNLRADWIRSARWLVEVEKLAGTLQTSQYQTAHDVIKDRWQYEFSDLLFKSDPVYAGLRPEFFYGIDNWADSELSIDEAREQSGGHIVCSVETRKPYGMPEKFDLKMIEPRSIDVIYRFIHSGNSRDYDFDHRAYPDLKEWENYFTGKLEGAVHFLKHDLDQNGE